jgi:hypothetical protein
MPSRRRASGANKRDELRHLRLLDAASSITDPESLEEHLQSLLDGIKAGRERVFRDIKAEHVAFNRRIDMAKTILDNPKCDTGQRVTVLAYLWKETRIFDIHDRQALSTLHEDEIEILASAMIQQEGRQHAKLEVSLQAMDEAIDGIDSKVEQGTLDMNEIRGTQQGVQGSITSLHLSVRALQDDMRVMKLKWLSMQQTLTNHCQAATLRQAVSGPEAAIVTRSQTSSPRGTGTDRLRKQRDASSERLQCGVDRVMSGRRQDFDSHFSIVTEAQKLSRLQKTLEGATCRKEEHAAS